MKNEEKNLNNLKKKCLTAGFALCLPAMLHAQTIYVSPKGKDTNPGTEKAPIATFQKAQKLARKIPANKNAKIVFDNGVYYLPETVKFTVTDSKTGKNKVVYMAREEGKAILSGGKLLKLSWKPYKDGIFVADLPKSTVIDQLFINGKRQRMARFPNAVAGKTIFDFYEMRQRNKPDKALDPLNPDRVTKWKNPKGGYVHAMHQALWGDMHWVIKGKKADGTLDLEGGWQNNRPRPMHPVFRMVENIFEELDNPGEWFFNSKEGKLYYIPEKGVDLKTAKVEIVRLTHLVEFNGSKVKPVKNVKLQGFVFKHAARVFMDNKEPLLRSDWTVYRGGAVVFNGAEDCSIIDSEFDQVGGNAIFVNKYNRRITIKGCYIHHVGANGIAFIGDPKCVRSALIGFNNYNDYKKIDRTPGPKGDNFPEDCLVEDCLITLTGRDEKQTAPVQISMSHKIRVNKCSIYNVPRAGINISENAFGNHIIENCDIFDTVKETGDHGSFNSWGRDRHWSSRLGEMVQAVLDDPKLPFLDSLGPTIIRNNRWQCMHGWDVDLDDGSSNYHIYNNLMLNGGLKLREGFGRIVTNNILVNNSLHPHLWSKKTGDVFKNNIVFRGYCPQVMTRVLGSKDKWGKEIDYNLFVSSEQSMKRYTANGCDKNSAVGDPMFIDPAKGDFRVKEGSPALKLGFKNFPMDKFGVQKPSLKAIAKTPKMPKPRINLKFDIITKKPPVYTWMGVVVFVPSGGDLSAYGANFENGGLALTKVPKNSKAAKLGLQTGDLILNINKQKFYKVRMLEDFIKRTRAKDKEFKFEFLRNQAPKTIVVKEPLPDVVTTKQK